MKNAFQFWEEPKKKKLERTFEHLDVINMYLYGISAEMMRWSQAKKEFSFMSPAAEKEISKSKSDKLECFNIKSHIWHDERWLSATKVESQKLKNWIKKTVYLSLKRHKYNEFNEVRFPVVLWDQFELAI